jgi:hypothetical protein
VQKAIASIAFVLTFLLFLQLGTSFAASTATVEGSVRNRSKRPIPGLTVYLAHPKIGRSRPSITSRSGTFYFSRAPKRLDPYYLEIYWGRKLIYRKKILVTPFQSRIRLKPIVLR